MLEMEMLVVLESLEMTPEMVRETTVTLEVWEAMGTQGMLGELEWLWLGELEWLGKLEWLGELG